MAQMLSKEGILYTGDLGYFKDMGAYRALYLAGREKFVIKQKGFNVFPGEVEAFIAQLDGVDVVEVVGIDHEVFDEGIVAFVREKPGADLTAEQVMAHCEGIASYKRPQHVVVWPAVSVGHTQHAFGVSPATRRVGPSTPWGGSPGSSSILWTRRTRIGASWALSAHEKSASLGLRQLCSGVHLTLAVMVCSRLGSPLRDIDPCYGIDRGGASPAHPWSWI